MEPDRPDLGIPGLTGARVLGVGGFGTVHEAWEPEFDRPVAVKVLRDRLDDDAVRRAFLRECQAMGSLSGHPHIVTVHRAGTTDRGQPYIVMDLMSGGSLAERIGRAPVPWPEVLDIGVLLAGALETAHRRGILHLDLKPANLLRVPSRQGREEQLKVLDFGIGQYIGDGEVQDQSTIVAGAGTIDTHFGGGTLTFQKQAKENDTAAGITRSRGCTPEYASPEQCEHVLDMDDIVQLDGRSDIYSLGVIAFEMLAGQLPFKAKNRLDVLQMHRQDTAPKVGSMGVRVPRKLAHFVDRCLEKDRDKRFRDTNEAYEALHDIVHPPVWKTVARVTVPIVLLALAIGAWAWTTREVVVPEAGLIAANGLDLETGAVFLGPATSQVTVALQAGEGVLPNDTSAAWTVVRALDGTPAPQWKAEWTDVGGVLLSATDTVPVGSRVEERLELVLGQDRLRSRPFTIVWLGEGAWEVSALELEGRDLEELEAIGIDPLGLSLDLELRGDARDDLAEVSVQVGGGEPLSLTRSTSSGDRSRYRLELADAGLTNGPNELHVRLRDRAGAVWSRAAVLTVVTAPLAVASRVMVDRSGGRDAEGHFPASNKILDAYLISPATEPMLRVDLVRPADLRWSVFVDGSSEPAVRGQSSGRKAFELDLTGLDGLNGGEAYLGRVEIAVDEDAYVLHADGSDRGAVTESVVFRFENTLPTFAAQWRARGLTRDLAASDLAAGDEGEPVFTNAASAEFVVTRDQPVPMRVELSWWPETDPTDVESAETSELLSPQAQQAVLPVVFTDDGEWILRARSFRFDSAAKAASDRHDVEQTFRIVLDRVAPGVELVGLDAGAVLTSIDSAPDELRVRFADLSSSAREPDVDLTWQLERTGS
uniref:serine/threonine-protein kinase n=1 Tax=Pseudonocardia sp. TaxID=60912 RepID=UPI002627A0C3